MSIHNKIVKQLIKLKNKKERKKTGFFIVEGERFINQIPKNTEILYYVFSKSFAERVNIFDKYKNFPIYTVEDNIFKKISDTINPQGALVVCKIKKIFFEDLEINHNSFFLVLDRVMDPGNLGTIIRTAEALGVSAIFLSKGCVDLYNDKVLRSTMGTIFTLPIIENCNIYEILKDLKVNGFNIICTHLKGEKAPFEVDFLKKTVLIIGNEANGVLDEYVKMAHQLVKIPMVGHVESMNASIAASIMFYEALSQRLK